MKAVVSALAGTFFAFILIFGLDKVVLLGGKCRP